MDRNIAELVDTIKSREAHLVVLSGNVYDQVRWGTQTFSDAPAFIAELTAKKFPWCISYDLFSGMKILRGDKKAVSQALGIKQQQPNDPNADLVNALKKAKMIGDSDLPVNPLEAFPCFDKLLGESVAPTVIVIDYADTLVPRGVQNLNRQTERVLGIALTKWSRSPVVRKNGHLIVLVSRHASDLDDLVLDRSMLGVQIRIPKPDEDARTILFVEKGLKSSGAATLGKATAGLSFHDLERIARVCTPDAATAALLDQVFALKQKVLRDEYGDLVEIMHLRNGFESIGGLEKPIAKLKQVAKAMRAGKTTLVPQGILFMGPPGTGKTVLAEAFAKESGLNFVKPLDIKSMWVGESERRMSRFLDAVRDFAPVVVFIDEFDQNQGARGGFDGDSGVSRSLFKKMLEIMSDTSLRGKVLWILATNRPDLIDSAMKRPGRCDLRIPFLPPGKRELELICAAALRQYPEMKADIKNWEPYAERASGFSGADMIEVVRRAWEHANEADREKIIEEDMEFALSDYKQQALDRPTQLRMTILALLECSSQSLMPDNWQEIIADHIEELTGVRPRVADEIDQSVINTALGKSLPN